MVRRRRKNAAPTLITGMLGFVFLVIIGGIILFAVSWVRGMLATPGSITPGLPSSTGPSENVKYQFGQVLPTWTGTKRVTVLLLGVDERTQETGPWRTDTMMLLTLDPATKMAGVLSIPRDLWVPIPGYSDGRINTAHFLGDLYKHTGGGPALARETIEYNLGVPVDYYVRLNFQAFVSIVDMIGGVDIYVEKDINDHTYPDYAYGYDPLYIQAGWHHFDGEMALKYARTRHSSSDFDRARRQQQVMSAVLEKVASVELLPDLAKNASEIYQMLEASVQTDMALDQILALANLATQIDRSTIRFGVIDQTCTQQWITPDGAQVLVPLRDKLREVRDYVFAADVPTPVPGQVAAVTPTPEVATLSVLNGTTRAGLAGTTSDYLQAQGLDIANVGNADRQDYGQSLVVMNRGKQLTAARIVSLLNLPATAVITGDDPNAAYDIVVILGSDYSGPPQN
ncbi:MAG: LCP family protein [Anaerolineae bacterium]|nr:LCP family protein [Anaerolineae bacterium]